MRQSDVIQARFRQVAISVLVGMGVVFMYLVYNATQFDDITDINAMDMAQVARNLAHGEGFTTKIIRPLSLTISKSLDRHPELIISPLHPIVASGLFRLTGASTARIMSWACGIAFLLTVGATYLLALKIFNPQVAILALVLVATDAVLLQYGVSGLESSLLTLLVTVLFLALFMHWKADRYRLIWAGVAGVLVGLIYLTQYAWVVVLLPAIGVVYLNAQPGRRAANVGVFLVLALAVMTPWFVRNYNVTGDPLFTFRWNEGVMGTYSYPGNTLYRMWDEQPPGPARFCLQAPREMYQKVRSSLLSLRSVMVNMGGPFVSAFFWVAILIPLGVAGYERVRKSVYILLLLLIGVLSLLGASPRLLVPLTPFVSVTAMALFVQLLSRRVAPLDEIRQKRWRSIGIGMLLAVHIVPLMLVMMPGFPTYYSQGPALERAVRELDSFVDEGRPVVCDVPWVIAWYGNRPSLWLPLRSTDMRRIESEVGRVEFMVLTPALLRMAEDEKAEVWATLWQRALGEDVRYGDWAVDQRLANAGWILFRRVPE
jgi:hypothetical protein